MKLLETTQYNNVDTNYDLNSWFPEGEKKDSDKLVLYCCEEKLSLI